MWVFLESFFGCKTQDFLQLSIYKTNPLTEFIYDLKLHC